MSYLQEFQRLLDSQGYSQFMKLWEEYCQADTVEALELLELLQMVKASPFAPLFGEYAESLVPLWQRIEDPKLAADVLKAILDIQTTNTALFADIATDYLKKKYGSHKHFNDFLRLSGLRTRNKFQGAISHFELLVHMEKGNFVFHTGGWGVGEIMDVSILREHALIEFEGISMPKDLSFENAFRNLVPLRKDHFLARRFGSPDELEVEGKEDPLKLIHLVLKDLGPKTASEIKDELADLVIPEKDWIKWWQAARSKIKKDTMIKQADSSKDRFELLQEEFSHERRFMKEFQQVRNVETLIQLAYQYSRDFVEVFKNPEVKNVLKMSLVEALEQKGQSEEATKAYKIQLYFLLDDIVGKEFGDLADKEILVTGNIDVVLNHIEIIAFKKRALVVVREKREDWQKIFLHLLFVIPQNVLRDYIFRELDQDPTSKVLVREKLKELQSKSSMYPEAFFWYFQKIAEEAAVPLNDKENKGKFLEAFFILLHYIETNPSYRELVKKMNQLLLHKRYLVFRSIIQDTSLDFLQEVLLLASKCHTLSKQDQKILSSLAEVVQPVLRKGSDVAEKEETGVIWTTAEGYRKVQERIQQIATVETIDNAKEIEAARALGDLRENSEYKFALERRARLQGEMKRLSRQINLARILTKEDIITTEVSVGTVVEVADSKGKPTVYTLLGPWDADPEQGILSFQSKLAQSMMGLKKGEEFEFLEEKYTVRGIKSFL